jgi:hypothetical protein
VEPYFQVGFVVPDLESAMEEIGTSLGVEMVAPQERDVGVGTLRISFAKTPPPYIELIQGPPGSVWDGTGGSRIHHLGYWSADMDEDGAQLEAGGMPLELDLGYARYHRSASNEGVRIELIALAHRATFFTRWGLPER